MATVILSTAGAMFGGYIGGPAGMVIGRTVGALAGSAIDNAIFGGGRAQSRQGPRLDDLTVQSSSEGAPIPRVYGWVRLTGQLIWATHLEEEVVVTTTSAGGKGGGRRQRVRTTEYHYYANFAIGLCEGPVHTIQRVWIDGKPVDVSELPVRFYLGTEHQGVDPLIAAKEGGAAPAYRGLTYAVFERLPLARFGNRIPQISFEVIRALPGIEQQIRAVTLIPGATEFGYATKRLQWTRLFKTTVSENRHTTFGWTNWHASLDHLQALCPALERVGLVVSWFGNDLRAAHCAIRPAVESSNKKVQKAFWRVSNLMREEAPLVSYINGRAAYGGTPSDRTVLEAIRNLKARGLKVTFIPFIMMDIPATNGYIDPWSGAPHQPAYPWRGRITCDPAPSRPGTPDKTTAIMSQINAIMGDAGPDNFRIRGENIQYHGQHQWSFRRMILHYAHLCALAGGVDAFLIGSELIGLTRLRSARNSFPFVQHLITLARDAKSILGPTCKVTYGADWSEYFGYHPQDGSNDIFFHLDPLWASPAIDMIGIDNYMPLADWHDGSGHRDAQNTNSIYNVDYLKSNIAGGEGYDWYYANSSDRDQQKRTSITDIAYDKPWVFRYKDLVSWWQTRHYNRIGGVESANSTSWRPQSKPVWFTELGCPAVDKGANQPNVFPDPKSSESTSPYYSTGHPDDAIQRRFLEAHLTYWQETGKEAVQLSDQSRNPRSSVYGGPMIDISTLHIWTWDARPFPYFPRLHNIWADGENWRLGHWLTGRLGVAPFDALLHQIAHDYDMTNIAVKNIDGQVRGYIIARPMSAREALEPLMQLGGFDAVQSANRLLFTARAFKADHHFKPANLATINEEPLIKIQRAQESELSARLTIAHLDEERDYQTATASSHRLATKSTRHARLDIPIIADNATVQAMADSRLYDDWQGRESVAFALPRSQMMLEPGDIITLEIEGRTRLLQLTAIEDARVRQCEARAIDPNRPRTARTMSRPATMSQPITFGKPFAAILELPILEDEQPHHGARFAVYAKPWPGRIALWRSPNGSPSSAPNTSGFHHVQTIGTRAIIGRLKEALQPGPTSRYDRANSCQLTDMTGPLASVDEATLFAGANAAAIKAQNGGWEIVQFANAELVGEGEYHLTHLLRGQLGTEDAMMAGHDERALFILINEALEPLQLDNRQIGLELSYQAGPANHAPGDDTMQTFTHNVSARGLMPYAPVHLRITRVSESDDILISWIRRTRFDGDSWLAASIPLNEEQEAYEVDIIHQGRRRRTKESTISNLLYTKEEQIADFGTLANEFQIEVFQISARIGRGIAAKASYHSGR